MGNVYYELWLECRYSQDGRSWEVTTIEETKSLSEWWLIMSALDQSPFVNKMWCYDEDRKRQRPFKLEKMI